MIKTEYNPPEFIALKCGCLVDEQTGELHNECMPHLEASFMQ